MLGTSKGIVLRSVKYGDTSLILNIFSEVFGLRAYMLKGIRSEKNKIRRAGLLQPASLLWITTEHKPNKQLHHIREFQAAYLYQQLQEDIVRNSIAIFSVELLQKLLPEAEVMEDLFLFCFDYFQQIDVLKSPLLANLPLFFLIQCGRYFGYNVQGAFSERNSYLCSSDGLFSESPPQIGVRLTGDEVRAVAQLIGIEAYQDLNKVVLNRAARNNILDWYIEFLQRQTQHLGPLRSVEILRSILH